MSERRNYDPNLIIQAADEKLANNDINGGQMLFSAALLDWVDDARENSLGLDQDVMREAIATLWIAYAHFLRKAKQFKSATEAYEQAVACPVSHSVGRVWLDYARFAEEREKWRTAQQVYLRALVDNGGGAVKDEQDRGLLWNEFLEMMRRTSPDLTMAGLQSAIEQEHGTNLSESNGGDRLEEVADPIISLGNLPGVLSDSADEAPPPLKRPRVDVKPKEEEESRTYVVTAADVDVEQAALTEILQNAQMDPDFTAAWMVRDGNAPPQPPEPPLFLAAPPKLSDPTGKDLLGEESALLVIQRLLEPSGSIVLEVCRAMWMLTAIKEQQSKKALTRFDETVQSEYEKLNAKLDERLSVAGAAEAAVRQMNETERHSFQSNCNQQRQNVLSGIAWEFRQLLWIQQQLLSKLKVPGFDGTTVDASALEFQARVCSYLHSAFYLRQRVGENAHVQMMKSQGERLKQQLQKKPKSTGRTKPSRFASATPPPPPPSQPQYAYPIPPLPPPQPQQQPYMVAPGYVYGTTMPPQAPPGMMMPPPGTYPPQQNFYQ